MDSSGITGIAAAVLIASILIITGATATIILGSTNEGTDDYEQIVYETVEEISTYIQIKDVIGKYNLEEDKRIDQITILISPLVSTNIELSELTLKLDNKEDIQFLYYNGDAASINGYSLFEHPQWDNQSLEHYSALVLIDKDNSLEDFNIINDHTDSLYLTIKLPEAFQLQKNDVLGITLFPSTGIERQMEIEAPPPLTPIVSLS